MRVGVDRRRAAVSGPAGVADTCGGGGRRGRLQQLAQAGELTGRLDDFQSRGAHQGDTRGVVAAVLQATEAVHENSEGTGRTSFSQRADVADDSTHTLIESC